MPGAINTWVILHSLGDGESGWVDCERITDRKRPDGCTPDIPMRARWVVAAATNDATAQTVFANGEEETHSPDLPREVGGDETRLTADTSMAHSREAHRPSA